MNQITGSSELDGWLDSQFDFQNPNINEPKKSSSGPSSPKEIKRQNLATSPPNSSSSQRLAVEHDITGTSPSRFNFLESWVKSLYTKISHGRTHAKAPFKKEVRSVFGWTDVTESDQDVLDEANSATMSTFSQEDKLPRLPVPKLKDTCAKYLLTVQPLLTPEEFNETKKAVEEFTKEGGLGEKLQQLLIERNEAEVPSWLEEWWDDAYLCGRDAIPINVNYFFAFEDDPVPEKNNQIGRAASLLRGALIFKRLLDKERVSPDMERGKPLCMSQYPRVFAASRIPGEERDKILTYTKWRPTGRSAWSQTTEYVDVTPTHVVVLYRNQFYRFDVIVNDMLLPLAEIESNLAHVFAAVESAGDVEYPVGVFTTLNRTEWYRAREKLIALDTGNKDTLEVIQSALMVVVLDNSTPMSLSEVSRVMLHGPLTNRWFDKHQLIVCANGKAGLNFEHSTGDGSTTLRVVDEMYKYSVKHTNATPNVVKHLGVQPVKLNWILSDELKRLIEKSYEEFREQVLINESSTLNFEEYGGQFIKDSNFSPDAYAQLAIQLAYYKMFGRSDATYESASTKQFLHGRTETARTVSNESVTFVSSTKQSVIDPFDATRTTNQLALLKMDILGAP